MSTEQPKPDTPPAIEALRLKWSGRYMIGFMSSRPTQQHSSDLFSTSHFVTARKFMDMGFRIWDQKRSVQVNTVAELNHYHIWRT